MSFYIGPAGAPHGCNSTEEGIRRVAELGLNLLEVEFVHGVAMSVKTAENVGKTARENGVRLSCHGPYFINLNSKEKAKIARSRKHILATMEAAHAMGAQVIAFHAGYYLGMEKEKVQTKIVSELKNIAEEAEKRGWADVRMGLETTGKHSAWGTLDEIVTACKSFKAIVPVIDFAHIYARTGGKLRTVDDFDAVLRKFEESGPKFLHSHFSCIKYSDKGELSHLSMEESKEPDFAVLAPALKRRGYDISIVCESPLLDRDALKIKKILRA